MELTQLLEDLPKFVVLLIRVPEQSESFLPLYGPFIVGVAAVLVAAVTATAAILSVRRLYKNFEFEKKKHDEVYWSERTSNYLRIYYHVFDTIYEIQLTDRDLIRADTLQYTEKANSIYAALQNLSTLALVNSKFDPIHNEEYFRCRDALEDINAAFLNMDLNTLLDRMISIKSKFSDEHKQDVDKLLGSVKKLIMTLRKLDHHLPKIENDLINYIENAPQETNMISFARSVFLKRTK